MSSTEEDRLTVRTSKFLVHLSGRNRVTADMFRLRVREKCSLHWSVLGYSGPRDTGSVRVRSD